MWSDRMLGFDNLLRLFLRYASTITSPKWGSQQPQVSQDRTEPGACVPAVWSPCPLVATPCCCRRGMESIAEVGSWPDLVQLFRSAPKERDLGRLNPGPPLHWGVGELRKKTHAGSHDFSTLFLQASPMSSPVSKGGKLWALPPGGQTSWLQGRR